VCDEGATQVGKLDWKWIAIGALVMVVLNFIASLVLALVLGPEIEGVTDVEDITLSSTQMLLLVSINILTFGIGGFIVGVKSAGRTIIEPGISAAIAVVIALLISGSFTIVNLIAGGLLPFVAGVVGGWLGELRQGKA
jgi:hypothetical protein